MVTLPPPYSPAAIVPENDAYSSGWSSVGTASRFGPILVGGPLGTAQLFRTPSRSSRRSQCTRSPVRPRGVWCSWTTKVSSAPVGSGAPAGGTGSAVRPGSRFARYSASGSADRPPVRLPGAAGGTSGAAAGALGRLGVVGRRRRRLRGRLLGRRLLRRRLLGRGGPLGRLAAGSGRLLRRRLLGGGALGRGLALVGRPTARPLHAAPQGAHQVDDGAAGVLRLFRLHDLAAGLLGLQQGGEGGPVLVGELGGIEAAAHRRDQRLGHLQLLRPHADVLVEEAEVRRPDLVGPAHGVQHHDAVPDPQRGQRLAV